MNDNLLQDVGENYEYVKTIFKNTIELKKIEAAESVSKILGKVIFGLISAVVFFIIVSGLSVITVLWLTAYLGSAIQAIAIICAVFILFLLVLYLFRKKLMYEPSISFINSLMTFGNID